MIYGNCKYEGKGCSFYHPPGPEQSSIAADETLSEPPRVASPISVQHLNAPEFVPAALIHSSNGTPAARSSVELPQKQERFTPTIKPERTEETPPPQLSPAEAVPSYPEPIAPTLYPLNYHLYHKSATPFPDLTGNHQGYFIEDDLREELQKRSEDLCAPTLSKVPVPEEVHNYHSVVPLESLSPERRKYFGHWMSSCYRATSANDGKVYVLRRTENFRLIHESAFAVIDPWRRLSHPNIVRMREAFTTRAFNDSSLIVTYDYFPLAVTLYDMYLNRSGPYKRVPTEDLDELVEEGTIWSYIIQISNAMKAVHDGGMALRILDPTKVLMTSKGRIRINCCGLADLVSPDPYEVMTHQQEDMISFGRLVLALCTRSLTVNNYAKALEHVARAYSADLKNAIIFLMSPHSPHKIIGQLFDIIGSRLLLEMDAVQFRADQMEAQLACELENGRLVRLLSKFGFINERPEFARDYRWSETGDKYIVKLFRDYVFHSVDENGRPVISLTHVLTHLNKLDAGSDERLMLVSRDEQSCLVVSYREIKRCVEAAFR